VTLPCLGIRVLDASLSSVNDSPVSRSITFMLRRSVSRTARDKKRSAAALKADAISRSLLGRRVLGRLKACEITQAMAAKVVADAATQMSRLANGNFVEFSADRLVGILLRLGSDVTLTIKHASRLGWRGRSTFRVV